MSSQEDNFNFDLGELVQQTFALAQKGFEEEVVESWPSGPGLVYHLDRGKGTFCIRCLAVPNLKEAQEEFGGEATRYRKRLRLAEGMPSFIQTDFLELAEILEDEFCHRRFPIVEDSICNISDPGFSWWMECGETHFQIFFQSQSVDRCEELIRLGPMGDKQFAVKSFAEFSSFLSKLIPLSENSITSQSWKISTSRLGEPLFTKLQDFFVIGEFDNSQPIFVAENIGRSLFLYLQELSLKRKFWMLIEEELSESLE